MMLNKFVKKLTLAADITVAAPLLGDRSTNTLWFVDVQGTELLSSPLSFDSDKVANKKNEPNDSQNERALIAALCRLIRRRLLDQC